MDINKFIIDLLDIQHRKQKDLAEYLAISTSTLNNWLKLNREIPSSYIIPICEFFKISPYLLLTGIDQDILNNLTPDETELLENYRRLRSVEKFKVLGRI
ncbi:MAG TPA: hypothetical protein DC000_04820, partial [Clostridiales bacterium]|nr:hypothetical protein [Clostridiales bacterium]